MLKRIRTIADKRGKHTMEEKKHQEAIKRYDTTNAVTLLSDQSVQGCNVDLTRLSAEKKKIPDAEATAKQTLNPSLSDDDITTTGAMPRWP